MSVKYKLIASNIYRELPSKLKYPSRVSFHVYKHQWLVVVRKSSTIR